MKLIQNYPLNWNQKNEFEINGKKVIFRWMAWNGSGAFEYSIGDLINNSATVERGNSAFTNISWFMFFVAVLASILKQIIGIEISLQISIGAFALCLISLCLYLFRKDKYEVFRTKNNESFGIRVEKDGREKPFIDELKKLLEEQG